MKIHLFGDFDGNEFSLTDESSCSSYGQMILRCESEGGPPVDYGRHDTVKTFMFEGRACDVVGNVLEMMKANFDDKELPFVARFVNGK